MKEICTILISQEVIVHTGYNNLVTETLDSTYQRSYGGSYSEKKTLEICYIHGKHNIVTEMLRRLFSMDFVVFLIN